MTAGSEEHEPLISSSVDNQRVTYNNSPQVSNLYYYLRNLITYISFSPTLLFFQSITGFLI